MSFIRKSAAFLVAFTALTNVVYVSGSCPCWTAAELDLMVDYDETVENLHLCEFYNENDSGTGQQGEGTGWKYGYVTGDNEFGEHYSAEAFVDHNDPYCVKILEGEFVWDDTISYGQANACLGDLTAHCQNHGR